MVCNGSFFHASSVWHNLTYCNPPKQETRLRSRWCTASEISWSLIIHLKILGTVTWTWCWTLIFLINSTSLCLNRTCTINCTERQMFACAWVSSLWIYVVPASLSEGRHAKILHDWQGSSLSSLASWFIWRSSSWGRKKVAPLTSIRS